MMRVRLILTPSNMNANRFWSLYFIRLKTVYIFWPDGKHQLMTTNCPGPFIAASLLVRYCGKLPQLQSPAVIRIELIPPTPPIMMKLLTYWVLWLASNLLCVSRIKEDVFGCWLKSIVKKCAKHYTFYMPCKIFV